MDYMDPPLIKPAKLVMQNAQNVMVIHIQHAMGANQDTT